VTLMTMREAAEYLRVSYSHTRRLVSEREIPSIQIGCSTRIDKAELDNWIMSKIRNRVPGRSFAEKGNTTATSAGEATGTPEAREGLRS